MKIYDLDILFGERENVAGSLLVDSFELYKKLGGTRDELDLYSYLKEQAKKYESNYIQAMDMDLSGIPVNRKIIRMNRLRAQVHWYIIHKWFNKPLRIVDYNNFSLEEFNRL